MRSHEWWNEHIVGALASYWVYQHLGNLEPGHHADDELLQQGQAGRRRLAAPRGVRPRGRRVDLGHALELLPRPRPHAAGGDRLARRAACSRRATARCSTTTSGTGSPSTSPATSTTCSWPRRCRGCSGRACTTRRRGARRWRGAPGAQALAPLGRAPAPGRRPRALGRVPGVVRAPHRAAALGGRGRARPRARVRGRAVRRRPPRLPVRGRLPARRRACGRTSSRRSARPIATRSRSASGG